MTNRRCWPLLVIQLYKSPSRRIRLRARVGVISPVMQPSRSFSCIQPSRSWRAGGSFGPQLRGSSFVTTQQRCKPRPSWACMGMDEWGILLPSGDSPHTMTTSVCISHRASHGRRVKGFNVSAAADPETQHDLPRLECTQFKAASTALLGGAERHDCAHVQSK